MTSRIAFMGSPDFAVPALAALLARGRIMSCACIRSRPVPRVAGSNCARRRCMLSRKNAASKCARRKSLKKAPEQEAFAALDLDLAAVVAYGLILPKPILDAPRFGCVNLHGSLLPRWRGAAPIQRALDGRAMR
jgi:methionyl-tRNA formyltransferase